MRGKLLFVGGLAVGFVLGARAGREKYEELVVKGRQVLDHPTVQEAAGVAQAQATRLYGEGKEKLNQSKLAEKLHNGSSKSELTAADDAFAGTPAGTTSGSASTAKPTPSPATTAPRIKSSPTGTNGSAV